MAKVILKECETCGEEYTAAGPAGRYCGGCRVLAKEAQRTKNREAATKRRRNNGARIGAGALPGKEHPNYKHGYYVAQTQARQYKELVGNVCERCEVDLSEVSRWMWCVHHKDHNHANHAWDNLELLCKRCHQLEHDCVQAFNKVKEIANG